MLQVLEYAGLDGSTAVSHVGAASSLNMRYDESVDTQPCLFSQREQDTQGNNILHL